MGFNIQDRRNLPRWQIDQEAQVKLEGAERAASCSIKDINLKGMRVCLGLKLPRDSFVKCCIILPGDCKLEIEAWIAWHKNIMGANSYGLYFTRIKDGDKEKIYKFVHLNCPKELHRAFLAGIPNRGGERMQENNFEDKRIFERFPADMALRFIDLKSNQEGQGRALDISAKGIGLSTAQELQPRSSVELWLEIPDKGEPLYIRGEVVWSKPLGEEYRAGISLEKADLMGLSRVLRAA